MPHIGAASGRLRRAARGLGFTLLMALAGCPPVTDLVAGRQAIAIRAEPVALSAQNPDALQLGALRYRGGLALSADHPAFGGLSGLAIGPDGRRLSAVTDKGNWVTARLRDDAAGRLAGVDAAQLGPLGEPRTGPIGDARGRDAEALALHSDGRTLVAFEGEHRILTYPAAHKPSLAGPATRLPTPDLLARAPANGGPEALAALADGRLVMLVERLKTQNARVGFLRNRAGWHRVRYPLDPDYAPTDAAQLPGGDLLVLARRFDPIGGFQARLRRIPAARLAPGAMLDGPVIAHFRKPFLVDNFEGLAVRAGPDGTPLVYIISDDNFRALQRTLLLVFALEPA